VNFKNRSNQNTASFLWHHHHHHDDDDSTIIVCICNQPAGMPLAAKFTVIQFDATTPRHSNDPTTHEMTSLVKTAVTAAVTMTTTTTTTTTVTTTTTTTKLASAPADCPYQPIAIQLIALYLTTIIPLCDTS